MRFTKITNSRTHHYALAAMITLPLILSGASQPVSTVGDAAVSAPGVGLPRMAVDELRLLKQGAVLTSGMGENPASPQSVKVSSPKGERIWTASAMSDHDVPLTAVRAYKNAASTMAAIDPACDIPWTLLAGIGRVESDHGQYGGSVLGRDGVSKPLIIGIPLNGVGPVAAIRDSDNGRLDKDKVWDRAVGPMQFIPTTWANAARDGDGDGVKSPNDIDDAALAAAAYLCSGTGSVRPGPNMSSAIYRYNQSDYYVALVMAFERGYREGVFIMPAAPEAEDTASDRPAKKKVKERASRGDSTAANRRVVTRRTGGSATTAASPSAPTSSPTPSRPPPTPSPKPTQPPPPPPPAPAEPDLEGVSGPWQACGDTYCLGGQALDLGPSAKLSKPAAGDFDADGTVETNAQEFQGLSGSDASLRVEKSGAAWVVYVIGDHGYRNADGSFARP